MADFELEDMLMSIIADGKGYIAIQKLCDMLKELDRINKMAISEASAERKAIKKFVDSSMPATKKVQAIGSMLD